MVGPALPDTLAGAEATWDSLPLDETDSKQMVEPQEAVSSSGKLSHVATAPGRVSGASAPGMDASGNAWLFVHGSAFKTGQYFLRLTSGNKTQAYSFSLPDCGGALLSIAGNPAGSADGSVWAESVTNCTSIGNTETAYVGGVVRFKP